MEQAPEFPRRIWAGVALAALALALGTLLIGVISNPGPLLVLIGFLLVGVLAGWYAVTRRGRARALALLLAAASLLLLVLAFVLWDPTWPRVIAVVVLGLVSIGAAQRALQEPPGAAAPSEEPLAPAPRQPVLIMNPRSGGGKAEKFGLAQECRQRGIEPVVLEPGDDLLQLAEDAIARGADLIGMAGGDGSQALVASVASAHDVPHVVVPAGTRNHFALDLGLDRDDVVGALDAYREGFERRIDLAEVNGRVFVNNASLGVYAEIVQSEDYRDAKLQTSMEKLPELLGPEAEPLDLRFTAPDGTERPSAHLIQVSNDPYELHHVQGRGTRPALDLGVLGIVSLKVDSAAEVQRFVTLEAVGQANRFPGFEEWSAPSFEIRSGAPVQLGVDGEALSMEPPLVFTSHPGALRVRVPRSAPGASPSARAVQLTSWSTVSQLVEVLMGRPES